MEIVSDLGATSLLGHGTRVWKVQKLGSKQPEEGFYALKDLWPHDDREPEHVVVRHIKEAQPKYVIHFLTIVNTEFVLVSYKGAFVKDHTSKVVQRGARFKATGVKLGTSVSQSTSNTPSQTQLKGKERTSGCGSYTSPSTRHPPMVETLPPQGHRDGKYLNQYPRRHYQMVSKEVGMAIYHTQNFPCALRAIQGALNSKQIVPV